MSGGSIGRSAKERDHPGRGARAGRRSVQARLRGAYAGAGMRPLRHSFPQARRLRPPDAASTDSRMRAADDGRFAAAGRNAECGNNSGMSGMAAMPASSVPARPLAPRHAANGSRIA